MKVQSILPQISEKRYNEMLNFGRYPSYTLIKFKFTGIFPMTNIIQPTTYGVIEEFFSELSDENEAFQVFEIGKSIRGRSILACRLGKSDVPCVLYVGAHHGMEHITATLLLKFISSYKELYEKKGSMYGTAVNFLHEARCIYIVPELNPDGVELAVNGASRQSPLYERLIKMNGGTDFSHWQANERGVDLNHNYNAGFFEYKKLENKMGILGGGPTKYSGESPESEPETSALCKFIRMTSPRAVLTLHTQGEEIYYGNKATAPKNGAVIAEKLGKLCGYKVSHPCGSAAYGGLTDWFTEEFKKPSFTIECGKGENPLPPCDISDIYFKISELLWKFPLMF